MITLVCFLQVCLVSDYDTRALRGCGTQKLSLNPPTSLVRVGFLRYNRLLVPVMRSLLNNKCFLFSK